MRPTSASASRPGSGPWRRRRHGGLSRRCRARHAGAIRRGVLLAVAILVLLGLVGAGDQQPSVRLASRPPAATAGTPWAVTVVVRPASAGRPALAARRGAVRRPLTTTAAGRGRWRARGTFPAAGRWTLEARVRGRLYRLGSVVVRPRPPEPLRLQHPLGLALEPAGTLLVGDGEGNRIFRVDRTSGALSVVAGTGRRGFSGDGGPAAAAMLDGVFDVAAEPDGDIVLGTHLRLRRIRVGTIETIAGNGIAGTSGDGGPARAAGLTEVGPIVLDRAGNLYVATAGGLVRRIDAATGTIATAAGTGSVGFSGDGGPATRAQLSAVHGLAVAPDEALVIADTENHRIRRVDPATGVITTIAGTGAQGLVGDGGPATSASLSWPAGLDYTADGTLVFVDSGNQRVRGVGSDGTISTLARDLGISLDLVVAGTEAFVSQPAPRRVVRVDLATGAITPLVAGR